MSYQVEYTPHAVSQLDRIPQADRKRIIAKIDMLADAPNPPGSRKLEGFPGFYRIRIGDYRVVYSIQRKVFTIVIAAIGHRGDIYRKLAKLLR